jgi:hypothetical protein
VWAKAGSVSRPGASFPHPSFQRVATQSQQAALDIEVQPAGLQPCRLVDRIEFDEPARACEIHDDRVSRAGAALDAPVGSSQRLRTRDKEVVPSRHWSTIWTYGSNWTSASANISGP